MIRLTIDASCARCGRWPVISTWLNWYVPCSKLGAFSLGWMGKRTGGSDREMDYHREVYWHRMMLFNIYTNDQPIHPKYEVSSTHMTCALLPKENTSTTSRQHSHQHRTPWYPTLNLTNCIPIHLRHIYVPSMWCADMLSGNWTLSGMRPGWSHSNTSAPWHPFR